MRFGHYPEIVKTILYFTTHISWHNCDPIFKISKCVQLCNSFFKMQTDKEAAAACHCELEIVCEKAHCPLQESAYK